MTMHATEANRVSENNGEQSNSPAQGHQTSDVVLASGPQPARLKGAGMKFTYTSGSRPLDGYTIKRGIGRGGFGEVYYAVSDGGKEVALKLIRRSFDVELRGVKQCLNLKHPNLLALHDIRQDDHDDHWVVMEYVSGRSLEDLIQDHPHGMPADEVAAWMHGVTAGVAYLHDHGIVHRDLKPGNIFSDEQLVKIGDYGLSKFVSCSHRSGQTESVGTVHYMAPEVANGRYGKEIDIYAMGVMLFEMLDGGVPFDGESAGEVLMKHLTAEPDLSSLSSPYREIVGRCLAKDPDDRYRSASDLLAALPSPVDAAKKTYEAPRVASARPVEPTVATVVVQPVAAAAVIEAEVVEKVAPRQEPIAAWLSGVCARIGTTWSNQNINTASKVLLLILGIVVLLFNAGWIIPLASIFGVMYLIYFACWAIFTAPSKKPAAQKKTPPAAAPPVASAHRRARRSRWHEPPAVMAKPVKTKRQWTAELCGSMALAALICLVMSVVMFTLRAGDFAPQQFVWLVLVSTFASWGVMIPAKKWEHSEGEPAIRRFTMLIIGLLVGAVAWAACGLLSVELPHEMKSFQPAMDSYKSVSFFDPSGQPSLVAFLAYFGFLFLVVRWWNLANPNRTTRLNLWITAGYVFWAGALFLFWPFPQPWGFMLVATTSIAIQLASPWSNSRNKNQPVEDHFV